MDFTELMQSLHIVRPGELPGAAVVPANIQAFIDKDLPLPAVQDPNGCWFHLYPHGRFVTMQGHRHSWCEIIYTLEGSMTHTVDGVSHTLMPGEVGIIGPGVYHKEKPSGLHDIAVDIGINLEMIPPGFQNLLSQLSVLNKVIHSAPSLPYIQVRFGTDSDTHEYGLLFTQDYYLRDDRGLTAELLLHLFLTSINRAAEENGILSEQRSALKIPQVLRYIQNHYADVTLDELSKKFGYVPEHLSRVIKEHCGIGFSKYRNRERLTASAGLLIGTDMSVTSIAAEVGIQSLSNFYRLFQDGFGVTPVEYRAQHKHIE